MITWLNICFGWLFLVVRNSLTHRTSSSWRDRRETAESYAWKQGSRGPSAGPSFIVTKVEPNKQPLGERAEMTAELCLLEAEIRKTLAIASTPLDLCGASCRILLSFLHYHDSKFLCGFGFLFQLSSCIFIFHSKACKFCDLRVSTSLWFWLDVILQSPFVSSLSQDLSALVRTENCLPLHVFPNLTSLDQESYRASSFSFGETFHSMAPHRSPMAWMPLGKEPTIGPVSSFGGSRAGWYGPK